MLIGAMKRLKTTQAGFSILEILLVVTIVGILTFVGWRVWDSQTSDTTSRDSKQSTNSNKKGTRSTDTTSKALASTPKDWSTYTNKVLGISFAYPKDWTFTDKLKDRTDVGVVRYGKSYSVGELVSADGTSMAIELERKQDGRSMYISIEAWKAYAVRANINYSELTEMSTSPLTFRYIQDVSGAKALWYEVLGPEKHMSVLVLGQETSQLPVLDRIVGTFAL
jgi:prepilin-type N-terminal cleavage/methylation domain-containing protein